ncbi:hypothetical protein DL98DRAFT_590426 [Cadophora sp. DSE1049]|nr:hypothetical protein DL98DRAFT_590426 [Cadophora sp. DSE1049]
MHYNISMGRSANHSKSSCISSRSSQLDCASTDFVWLCERFHFLESPHISSDELKDTFENCARGCPLYDGRRGCHLEFEAFVVLRYMTGAPGKVLDLCEAVGLPNLVLPKFMQNQIRLYGRQLSDESSSIGSGPSTPETAETVTSTQGLGSAGIDRDSNTALGSKYPIHGGLCLARRSFDINSGLNNYRSALGGPVHRKPYERSPDLEFDRHADTKSHTVTIWTLSWSQGWPWCFGSFCRHWTSYRPLHLSSSKTESDSKSLVEPQETDDGGLPEHASGIPKVDLSKFPENPSGFRQVHELGHDEESDVIRRDVHELNNEPALRHEMNAGDTPGGDALARTAREDGSTASTVVSNPRTGDQEISPVIISAQTEQTTNPAPRPNTLDTEETEEVREMKQEMAHIQARKEQLQRLQALEAREEELKRTIEQWRAEGGS